MKRMDTGSEDGKTFKNESYATALTLEAELDEHLIDIDKTTPTVEDLVKDVKISEESIMGRCSLGRFDGISDKNPNSSLSTRFASTPSFNRNFSNNIPGGQQNSRFSDNYRPPRRINEVSGISSGSGYNGITRRANGRRGDEGGNGNQSQSHANDTGSSSRDADSRNAASCWNCGGLNHTFRNCRDRLRQFCFRCDFVGLLDSGSNRSIVGGSGSDVIQMFELKMRPTSTKFVSTADGVRQTIEGIVDIPLRLDNSSKIIPFIVVPSCCHSFIFGGDFCKTFNFKINFEEKVINVNSVSDEQETRSDDHFLSSENLSKYQRERVETISEEFIELSRGKLGRTNKLIYHIDTSDAKPVKRRQYLLSPYMLEHSNVELDKIGLGVVEPSMSGWSSPVLLVKKPNHAALKYLSKIEDPFGKLARWSIKLSQYDRSSIGKENSTLFRMHFPEDRLISHRMAKIMKL
ncbi:hypothetical protein JTB14_005813 [Gonioctena quinquepunctata]|nr:hypothetical protein JTB14_005813 [Gonioctena quinquepunctata]